MFFQDNSQIYNINLSKEVYEKMLCYCNKAYPYETGGILIGNYSRNLGEWHYHPNASSLPSGIDNKQMIKLSRDKKLNCPEPILIIIGGYKDNWSINARLYVNSEEIIMNLK